MLREIAKVKQERGQDRRRWFTDHYWDLYVWVRKDGGYAGFQLCYGKPDAEHALTWMGGGDPTHAAVSETSPGRAAATNLEASILVADGAMDVRRVAQQFWRDSRAIDEGVRLYVIRQLKQLM